jgi:hydrogenase maturation factor
MCLTIPKQVILCKNGAAILKSRNGRQNAGSIIKVKKGDWVLTQNNIIIQKISEKQAKEINMLMSSQGAERRRTPVQ